MAKNKESERASRYNAQNTTRVYLNLNNNYDKDIIGALESVPNKAGLIKQLLRNHFFGVESND